MSMALIAITTTIMTIIMFMDRIAIMVQQPLSATR
jgi:hypothetical protein